MTHDGPSKDPADEANPSPWWKRRWGVALVLFVVLVVISWLIADDDVEDAAALSASAVAAVAGDGGQATG